MNPWTWLERARTHWRYVLGGFVVLVLVVLVLVFVNRTFRDRQQRLDRVTLHKTLSRVAAPGSAAPLEDSVNGLLSVPPALDRLLRDRLTVREEWGPPVRHNVLRPGEVPLQEAPSRRGPP